MQLEFFAEDDIVKIVPNFSLPTFSHSSIRCIGVRFSHSTFQLKLKGSLRRQGGRDQGVLMIAGRIRAVQAKHSS